MPLKLEFKSGDKLMINGAILENAGANARILVHNESAILREKEILTAAETETPASRVYFALQCAYAFPHKADDYLDRFRGFLKDYVTACPSAKEIGESISKNVDQDRLYQALKATQKLIGHEIDTVVGMNKDVAEAIRTADAEAEAGAD